MTQKRMQLITCVSLLLLTVFSYMFRLFSAVQTGVKGEGIGEQAVFLTAPFLAVILFFLGMHWWEAFEKQEIGMPEKEKTKNIFIRITILIPIIGILSFLFQTGQQLMGFPLQWIMGIVVLILAPYCLDVIFKCWEDEGKHAFWLCLGASASVTALVFLVIGNSLVPYLILYAGMYLLLYLSMIWQAVRRENMDLPQGLIAAFAITVLVLAGIAVCLYPKMPYVLERMDAWMHPGNWWHGKEYETVRTMLSHSDVWGHYSYAPGKVSMVQYLEYYAAAIPMTVLYYGGWFPAVSYTLIVLLFGTAVGWGYCQMHKMAVPYLSVYRMLALFWILRCVLGLLGSFTILPLNLSLPFASASFYWEDAALLGVFLHGLWGEQYTLWKERVIRSVEFHYDAFDEVDVYDHSENEDKPDEYNENEDDFDNSDGEWEELEEYGEV